MYVSISASMAPEGPEPRLSMFLEYNVCINISINGTRGTRYLGSQCSWNIMYVSISASMAPEGPDTLALNVPGI